MKKLQIYLLVSAIISTQIYAQEFRLPQLQWMYKLDSMTFMSMIRASDGGVIAIGDQGGIKYSVMKINDQGIREWQYRPVNDRANYITSLQYTDTEGVYSLGGYVSLVDLVDGDICWGYNEYINNQGMVVWTRPNIPKQYNYTIRRFTPYIESKNKDNVTINLKGNVTHDSVFFRRINSEGIILENRLIEVIPMSFGFTFTPKLIETKDSCFVFLMYITTDGSYPDYWKLTKVDRKGNVLHTHQWTESPKNEQDCDMIEAEDGSLLVLTSVRDHSKINVQGYIRRFSTTLELLETKVLYAKEKFSLSHIVPLPQKNGYVISGTTTTYDDIDKYAGGTSFIPAMDGFVCVVNNDLSLRWSSVFGIGGRSDIIKNIIPITDEEFYVGGFYDNYRAIARVKFTPVTSVAEEVQHTAISYSIVLDYAQGKVQASDADDLGIYDLLGQRLLGMSGERGNLVLDTQGLPAGLYYAHAQDKHGNRSTLPLIVR